MLLTRLLNACHHFPGFVYAAARLIELTKTIEIEVRPRKGSRGLCSGCVKPAPGYDQLPERRFEFIPLWGFAVVLLYSMRRVACAACGVKVEAVPWGMGKHTLTRAYMLYLAHWARKLSWKETALSFNTSWEKVCQAVEYVVGWGLEQRQLGPLRAIGVDEIAYGKGHDYLTLVYQIDAGVTRLLWVGEERTKASFQKFFDLIGQDLASKIEFVCSDMWKPYLNLIAKNCTNALNILDRFHIVAKLNKALDEVRASEARRLVKDGYEPVLKKSRWCLLKRKENLTDGQRIKLRDVLRYNLHNPLHIQIPYPQRIALNKRPPGFNVVAHQRGEYFIGRNHVIDLHPEQNALGGVHSGFPQLSRVHFAEALVALDGQAFLDFFQ